MALTIQSSTDIQNNTGNPECHLYIRLTKMIYLVLLYHLVYAHVVFSPNIYEDKSTYICGT